MSNRRNNRAPADRIVDNFLTKDEDTRELILITLAGATVIIIILAVVGFVSLLAVLF